MHKFTLLINGELVTYNRYEDIPNNFDNVIEFIPDIPKGPHTDEQHDEISKWNDRLRVLIEKENRNIGD